MGPLTWEMVEGEYLTIMVSSPNTLYLEGEDNRFSGMELTINVENGGRLIVEEDIPQGETSTTMQISVGAGSTLESGKTLSVKLESSANNFSLKLTGGSDAIGYKVEKDNQAVNAGGEVLSWTGGEAIPAAATLTMALTESTGGKTAGEYSDTLTFKLSLGTTGFNATHDGFEDGDEVDW